MARSDHAAGLGITGRTWGVSLPSAPGAGQDAELARLKTSMGAAFDREYARAALDQNRRDVARFEQAAASTANDRRLRNFAEAQLPALEQSTRLARATVEAHRG